MNAKIIYCFGLFLCAVIGWLMKSWGFSLKQVIVVVFLNSIAGICIYWKYIMGVGNE
jgi:positive regulator of sigma E activity